MASMWDVARLLVIIRAIRMAQLWGGVSSYYFRFPLRMRLSRLLAAMETQAEGTSPTGITNTGNPTN